MLDAGRRPMGRLSCWVVAVVVVIGAGLRAFGGTPVPDNGPAKTTVADTVYMADGSGAQGSLIIAWPAFVTASGSAVAAGNDERDAGCEWWTQRGAGAECGRDSGRCVLHRRLPNGAQSGEDRILGGADDVPSKPGASADDSGIRRGGATGLDAVREFRAGDEGGRQLRCTSERHGDDQRREDFCRRAECSGAYEFGPSRE